MRTEIEFFLGHHTLAVIEKRPNQIILSTTLVINVYSNV